MLLLIMGRSGEVLVFFKILSLLKPFLNPSEVMVEGYSQ